MADTPTPTHRRGVLRRLGRLFGSLELSCTLLVLLGVLTWLGTLAQVEHGLYEAQKTYFESYVLIHWLGSFPLPLPGANLLLSLLFANLFVGGVLRLRRSWSTAGVLVTHLGIALLLVAGFVKLHLSEDGHLTLFEGQQASHFQSYHRWELVVTERRPDGERLEHVVPQERFLDATPARPARLDSPALPFSLQVEHVLPNARPRLVAGTQPAAGAEGLPAVGGVSMEPLARDSASERNAAAVFARVLSGANALGSWSWGRELQPSAFDVDGRAFTLGLRRERYPMPFSVALDDFEKQDHPRLDMPRSFASEVRIRDASGERPVRISMNQPLRAGGLVLYQASWGPAGAAPGAPLFSTLAVVRNPADQLPLVGCLVIALGLGFHFGRMLWLRLRRGLPA